MLRYRIVVPAAPLGNYEEYQGEEYVPLHYPLVPWFTLTGSLCEGMLYQFFRGVYESDLVALRVTFVELLQRNGVACIEHQPHATDTRLPQGQLTGPRRQLVLLRRCRGRIRVHMTRMLYSV